MSVIAAVGAYKASVRELDAPLMESSAVIVDSRTGALKESGAILMSKVTWSRQDLNHGGCV